jgi:hypothetical protein
VEAAAELALAHAAWQLRDLKSLLKAPASQAPFAFAQHHPLIRDLSHYEALLPDCFAPDTENNLPDKQTNEPSQP